MGCAAILRDARIGGARAPSMCAPQDEGLPWSPACPGGRWNLRTPDSRLRATRWLAMRWRGLCRRQTHDTVTITRVQNARSRAMRGFVPTMLIGEDGQHCLKFPDDFFGRQPGVGLGREIIRGHDTGYRLALDGSAGLPMRGYGRAPIPRSALVGNNRISRQFGHGAPGGRPRAPCAAMSTPVRDCRCHASSPGAFDRRGWSMFRSQRIAPSCAG
jgi:hypothetical protein